jgi:IS1 family transposase
VITDRPDLSQISSSHVERQNWKVRTTTRRNARLSSGFSRKIESHMAEVAINCVACE